MLGHFLCPVLGVRGVNSVNYNLSLLPITTISALESASQGYFVIFHIGTERGRYFVIFQTYFRTVCSSDPQGTSIGDSLVAFPGLF